MKPRLLILSDLWGFENTHYCKNYTKHLTKYYDIQYYDCRILGGVTTSASSEEKIHNHFLDFGINNAVQQLLTLEVRPVHILAFSIGGLIAWKAVLKGLQCQKLILISSNRIRYETEKPKCDIQLYFASEDKFTPKKEWFQQFNLHPIWIENAKHNLYTNSVFIKNVCKTSLFNHTTKGII